MKNFNLPMSSLSELPTENANAKEIVALVRESGRTVGYKLSDGTTLTKEEGVNLARQGGIKGVGIARRNQTEYLKSIPDGTENNNLGNLPSVTQ